ncbi:MAG: ArnT family glycosyltransferase [Leptospirillia bacterium]
MAVLKSLLSRFRGHTGLLLLVVGLILAVDGVYAAYGVYRPVIADAKNYYSFAQYLLGWIGHHWPWLRHVSPSPDLGLPLPDARDLVQAMAYQGPGYPVVIALFKLFVGEDVAWVRLFHSLLHAATALLVFGIGRRLGGIRVAWVATLLFAAYLPYTYMATQILTENLASFLLVASVYLTIRLPGGGRRAWWWGMPLAMLCVSLLALTRPVFMPYAVVYVVALGVYGLTVRRREGRWEAVGAFGVGAAVCLIPYLAWLLVLNHTLAFESFTFSVTGERSIADSFNASYHLPNQGWPRPNEGYLKTGKWPHATTVAESVREAPLASLALRVEKFHRLWHGPATAYTNPLLVPAAAVSALHGLVVFGAVLGALLARRGAVLLFTLLPVAFISGVHTLYFSEERRFTFVVMAFVIVLAAVAWVRGVEALTPCLKEVLRRLIPPRLRTAYGVWTVVFAGSAAVLFAENGFLLFAGQGTGVLHATALVLFDLCLLAAAARFAAGVGGNLGRGERRLRFAAITLLIVLPVTVHQALYDDWRSFGLALDHPGQRVRHEITLPPGFDWGKVVTATLQIDLRDGDGRLDDLDVRINGRPARYMVKGWQHGGVIRKLAENLNPIQPYDTWKDLHVVPGMRFWLVYRLAPDGVIGSEKVTVTLQPERVPAPGTGSELFGDLGAEDSGVYPGPRPWLTKAEWKMLKTIAAEGRASYWRYQTRGDMRLYGGTTLSGARRSFYAPDAPPGPEAPPPAAWRSDLSDAPLIQRGAYRILLQLITADGTEIIL